MKYWILAAAVLVGVIHPASAQTPGLDRILRAAGFSHELSIPVAAVCHFADAIARAARVPMVFQAAPISCVDPVPEHGRVTLMGKTVREALDVLTTVHPQYRWFDIDGVIVIRTLHAWATGSSR